MKLLDVITEDGQVVGQVSREECHVKGLRHLSVFVFILNAEGKVYLQQRAKTKIIRPEKLTASACGHVHAGESLVAAARRELEEELGICTTLEEIGCVHGPYDYDKEFVTVYVGQYQGQMNPNKDEIECLVLLTLDEIEANLVSPAMNFGETFKKVYPLLREYVTTLPRE
jgi:isopentenyl-diphosphate delta-isomerase